MQVTIELNDELTKKLLNEEIQNIPKENIQQILCDAIGEYLKNKNNADSLFVVRGNGYYGNTYPSKFLENVVMAGVDLKEFMQPVTEMMVEYIREHKDTIMPNIIENIFIRGLSNSTSFQSAIKDEFAYLKADMMDNVVRMLNKNN